MDVAFKIGDRVRFLGTGRYEATVMEIEDGKIKVHWDFDGPEFDWRVNDFDSVYFFERVSPEGESAFWGHIVKP